MITKKELEQLESTYKEQEDLKDRIEKLEATPKQIVKDSVRSSSKYYPYTQHNTIILGFEEDNVYKRRKKQLKKMKKMFLQNQSKISKRIENIEYELNKIEDSEIRRIIRYKYEDNLSFIQISHKMNENKSNKVYTADSIRMTLNRFLEKNK